jgi:hypothetical protein
MVPFSSLSQDASSPGIAAMVRENALRTLASHHFLRRTQCIAATDAQARRAIGQPLALQPRQIVRFHAADFAPQWCNL